MSKSKKNNNKNTNKMFRGSIDELLDHANGLDVSSYNDVEAEHEKTIHIVCNEFGVDREQAEEMINDYHLSMVQKSLDEMIEAGIVEIVSYDANNEPLYGLTEKGKKMNNDKI